MVCYGQTVLSLDSCRAMALRNNKQMRVAEVRRDVAANVRRAARTKYLPHVSAVGGYEHTSREISLLSDAQKSALGNLGSELSAYIPTFDRNVRMKVYYIKEQGSYAVWKATKANGQYDLRTFEVKARPVEAVEGLRPGMSVVIK